MRHLTRILPLLLLTTQAFALGTITGGVSVPPVGGATLAEQIVLDGHLQTIGASVTHSPVNANGSGSSTTVSTVQTLTVPAGAVGFVLMNLDTSSANVRWAIGRVASSVVGEQLQPGRDTGFVPAAADVSVCAESGTQSIDVQWVVK